MPHQIRGADIRPTVRAGSELNVNGKRRQVQEPFTVRISIAIVLVALIASIMSGQPAPEGKPAGASSNEGTRGAAGEGPPDYVLGPDDQIVITVLDSEEFTDKPVRVDMSGYVRLPYAGRVRMAGLTIEQARAELTRRLHKYFRAPEVSVSVAEFRSQPVSVIGAVKQPGVHQLEGRKNLIEVLALAGGLETSAGPRIKITRRIEWGRLPLSSAADDPAGEYSVAEVSVRSLLDARNPGENIAIRPFDVISVPRAELIYVTGQVARSGGFVLNENETITVLQAISLAGGIDRTASPKNARILRRTAETTARAQIAVDLTKIFEGKTADVAMQPEDILFIPSSAPKRAALRALEAAVQMGTGIVIWRR